MSRLYEAVHVVLAAGPRTTEEVVTGCRRLGLGLRPETVQLFLRLSREVQEQEGRWITRGGDKRQRILAALQRAFAGGGAYVPLMRLAEYLEGEAVTEEEVVAACGESGQYRFQGQFILRA